MWLKGTGNLSPLYKNTQGHETEATHLGEESNNSLPKVVWILIQANTGKKCNSGLSRNYPLPQVLQFSPLDEDSQTVTMNCLFLLKGEVLTPVRF